MFEMLNRFQKRMQNYIIVCQKNVRTMCTFAEKWQELYQLVAKNLLQSY